jgi:hypothetical protein
MEIKEALDRLESFKSLKAGWDSYGGLPPSKKAIEKAESLLKGLFVCPLNNGSVSISLGDERVNLIITNHGDVFVSV